MMYLVNCLLISLVLPFIHPYASRSEFFKFTMLPLFCRIISLGFPQGYDSFSGLWWGFLGFGGGISFLFSSLVLGGGERSFFLCLVFDFFFLNANVTCQPKHEDKIEPCRCCFGFVMNQQVGSFT